MQITRKDLDAPNAVITIAINKGDLSPKIDRFSLPIENVQISLAFARAMYLCTDQKAIWSCHQKDEANKMLQESLSNYISKEKIALLGNPPPVEHEDWD